MTDSIRTRLQSLGQTLPDAPPPASPYYVPYVRSGNLLYLAGQISGHGNDSVRGRLGDQVTVEQGRRGAEICALGLLSQLDAAIDGDIRRVRRIVRVGVYVASTPEFAQHSEVGNGVSALLTGVFKEHGLHARTSIGVASLPAGMAVEADAVIELVG